MRALFFDMATRAGFAFGSERGVEGWGAFELPRTGDNVGRFLCAAEVEIRKVVEKATPELIAFEAPFINRKIDDILKIRKLSGLANEVEKAAERYWQVPCKEALVDQVRRHFLGRDYPRGSARAKQAVRVKCREMGWDVEPHQDDEADALAGLSFILATEMPSVAILTTPLFEQKTKTARA